MKYKICTAGTPTKSNKIYSYDLLQEMVEKSKPLVDGKVLCGELGIPSGTVVRYGNVSHLVSDLYLEINYRALSTDLCAEIETIDTPMGRLLDTLIKQGKKVSFHLCGVGGGQVENGMLIINKNYKLIQIYATQEEEICKVEEEVFTIV